MSTKQATMPKTAAGEIKARAQRALEHLSDFVLRDPTAMRAPMSVAIAIVDLRGILKAVES
jgi:hypothetical protein